MHAGIFFNFSFVNTAVCKFNIFNIRNSTYSYLRGTYFIECCLLCITDGPVANDYGSVKCPSGYKFNLKSQVCDGE